MGKREKKSQCKQSHAYFIRLIYFRNKPKTLSLSLHINIYKVSEKKSCYTVYFCKYKRYREANNNKEYTFITKGAGGRRHCHEIQNLYGPLYIKKYAFTKTFPVLTFETHAHTYKSIFLSWSINSDFLYLCAMESGTAH